jgi:hypothetical protein
LHALSRVRFVFCFERDPHALFSTLFQKAKMLPNTEFRSMKFTRLGGQEFKIRISNDSNGKPLLPLQLFWTFEFPAFWHCFGFRASDFGLTV